MHSDNYAKFNPNNKYLNLLFINYYPIKNAKLKITDIQKIISLFLLIDFKWVK